MNMLTAFHSKKVLCKKHKESIIGICVFPKCNFNSILICTKCMNNNNNNDYQQQHQHQQQQQQQQQVQQAQQQHYNIHKSMIYNINDFFNNQVYAIDIQLIDELLSKCVDIQNTFNNIDANIKKDETNLDNDFEYILNTFNEMYDNLKTQIKDIFKEHIKHTYDKYIILSNKIKDIKMNKIDIKEKQAKFNTISVDKVEDFLKNLITKRHHKFLEFNKNICVLKTEINNIQSTKPTYNQLANHINKYIEEFKNVLVKNFHTLYMNIKSTVEKTTLNNNNNNNPKSNGITNHTASNCFNLMQQNIQPLASVADSVFNAPLKSSCDPSTMIAKIKAKKAYDSNIKTAQAKCNRIINKLNKFPEIQNPSILQSLEVFGPINYSNSICEDNDLSPKFGVNGNMSGFIEDLEIFEFEDGIIYQGQLKDNKRNGYGKQLYPDGGIYEGEWKNDIPYGYGRLTRNTGDIYEGYVENSKANGPGIFCSLKGYRFQGEWIDDQKNGYGEEYIEGTRLSYQGYYKNDKFHGTGRLDLEDGRSFEGNFINGAFSGYGICVNTITGESYEGEWRDWLKHGQGLFITTDGDQFEGNFENDLPEGYGIFKFSNGSIFKGYWVKGKQHGKGIQIDIGEPSKEGEWNQGYWVRWL